MPNHSDEWYEDRGLSLELPEYMISALKRGLDLHEQGKSGDGLQPSTVRWATKGVEEGRWSAQKWVDCDNWFSRHNHDFGGDKDPFDRENPGAGEVAWFLWGDNGDGQGPADAANITETCGRKKAHQIHERIKEMDKEKTSAARMSGIELDPNPYLCSILSGSNWCINQSAFANLTLAALTGGDVMTPDMFGITSSAQRLSAIESHNSSLWCDSDEHFDPYYDAHVRDTGIGILPVRGIIWTRSFWGMCGYDTFVAAGWAMAADPRCRVIVIPIDSPGGMATGFHSACAAIRKWREIKPVITIADYMSCSAAEAIASQGSISLAGADSEKGHIGNWVAHDDISKMFAEWGINRKYYYRGANKVFFQSENPRTEEADHVFNAGADYVYDLFCGIVEAGRSFDGRVFSKQDAVDTQAMLYYGAQAIDVGIADAADTEDGLITFDDLIVSLES